MGLDNISDKVNINLGEGRGSDSGAGLAAVIAALGNRNQGDNTAALIAALGNRNDDSSNWAPFMAMMGDRRHDDGMNNLWPIILLALLGRGKGGGLFGGGDGDCGGGGDAVNQITLNQVLAKLGTIEGQVPLVGSQVQNSILEQTIGLSSTLNQNNIAQLVAHANTKDAVTNSAAALLAAGNNNTNSILTAITGLSSKIDSNTIMDLQRQLGVAQAREAEERSHRHIEATKVEVTQSVTQNQAQLQGQAQAQVQSQAILELTARVRELIGDVQAVKQGQVIFNSGSMLASGTQAAANTKVA